ERAVKPDGPVISLLPQQGDEALAFAQPVNADLMCALLCRAHRDEKLLYLPDIRFMAKNRKAEGRLGDEEIAGHGLERRAGRIGPSLVVAGDDGTLPAIVEDDLGAAEDMSGGNEC